MDYAEGKEETEHLGTFILAVMDLQEEDVDTVLKVLRSCHNSRVGHFGGRRTYNRDQTSFHRIFKDHLVKLSVKVRTM